MDWTLSSFRLLFCTFNSCFRPSNMADVHRRPRPPVSGSSRPPSLPADTDQRPPEPPRSTKPHRTARTPVLQARQIEGPGMDSNSRQENDFLEQREDVLERLHTFQAPYEGLESLFSPFENYTTRAARATFKDGRMLAELREDAAIIKPTVGLIFLAGADTPQVRKQRTSRTSTDTATGQS
jgi:hypothetical protein